MTKIAAVVPAYNEERSIASVVADIHAAAMEHHLSIDVVVVNDCSTDSTGDIISGLPCIAIHLPVNLGIGGAVQTGFKFALENRYDYALQIDGDGQHPASEIHKLILEAERSGAEVVIGSRFLKKEGFQSSALRRFGIAYFKWLNNLLVGVQVTDSTSGFRLISRNVMETVSEHYPDEYPEPETIIIYSLKGFKISEAAVEMKERQGGVSSIGTFASVYYMIKVSLAIVFTFIRMKIK